MANRRSAFVWAALLAAVTASLGLWAAGGEPSATLREVPPTNEAASTGSPLAMNREASSVDLPVRGAQEGPAHDLFAAHTWRRPPPPLPPVPARVEPPPAPPPPVAPPAPFTLLGTFEAVDGKTIFYIAEGQHLHTAAEGEVLNGVWRIEKATGEGLVLLYLPLSLRQTLAFARPK